MIAGDYLQLNIVVGRTVGGITGVKREVEKTEAYVHPQFPPGVVVTRDPLNAREWAVTHRHSGARIFPFTLGFQRAVSAAVKLTGLIDWRLPMSRIYEQKAELIESLKAIASGLGENYEIRRAEQHEAGRTAPVCDDEVNPV